MIGDLHNNRFVGRKFDQIVIGCGSSALNFLQSAREGTNEKLKGDNILVIGKSNSDLWARTERDHPMGQPPQLLQRRLGNDKYPALKEKIRPTGLSEQSNHGIIPGEYVTAGAYTDHLSKVRQNLAEAGTKFLNATVRSGGVTLNGDGFKVVDESGNCYYSKTVIVASGIGPAKTLNTAGVTLKGISQLKPVRYPEIVDAVTYYNAVQPKRQKVLVYGGSATASWAAAHARKMEAAELLWLCRKGIDQISTEGNPVGRNSETIRWAVTGGLIEAGEIVRIEAIPEAKAGDPRLRVFLKLYEMKRSPGTLTHNQVKDHDREVSCDFHQVVYAVGSNPLGPGGPGDILATNIREALQPVYAKDYQFLTEDDKGILLAYTNANGTLWVVGAAVFGGLGVKRLADLKEKYAKVGEYLPQAGTPPEGIAILKTTIDALTGRMETDVTNFDWNRARPEEIENLFKKLFPFPQLTFLQREAIVKDLVKLRSDCKFVLSQDVISKFIGDFNEVYGTKLDVRRLKLK
jgi:hypothetical protein